MKKIILLLILTAQFAAFGQTPDQQSIPEFVLKGKSADELRIMRNEIFARYGYIFQSSDLTDYFNNKSWYNPSKSNVDDQLTNVDKANIELISKFEDLAKKKPQNPVYTNETNAYFRVVYDPETQGNIEISRNVTFHYHCKFGTIKKTVERTFFGGEATPTVVYAETSEPNKPFWETTKYFNDLKFNCSYFEATNYGCCGAENYSELFNYESNEPILAFNEAYYFVEIPNSKIQMFIGYNHEVSGREGLNIATLYLSTLDGVVSSVKFVSTSKQSKEDIPWYFTPKIELRTNDNQNKIIRDGKELRLWSSNFAKGLSDVNGFSIFVEFRSEGNGKKAEFDIPVVNGKFYGSDELGKNITVNLD